MGTKNNSLYMVTFTISQNVNIEAMAYNLDMFFDDMGLQFFREISGNKIEYRTLDHESYFNMQNSIYELTERNYYAYIREISWNNYD